MSHEQELKYSVSNNLHSSGFYWVPKLDEIYVHFNLLLNNNREVSVLQGHCNCGFQTPRAFSQAGNIIFLHHWGGGERKGDSACLQNSGIT